MAAAAAVCFCEAGAAHGLPKQIHGGLVATELDLGFEMFMQDRRLVVLVTDHDSPFDTRLFKARAVSGQVRIPLASEPGGRLVSAPLQGRLNLRTVRLTLSASVLPEDIRINFDRSP